MESSKRQFEQAALHGRASLAQEFVHLLAENKKWWLLPIVVALGLVSALILLAGTGAAPFIYTMF